jgi:hypothetical protein
VWVVHTAGPDIQAASFRVVSTWSATFINAVYPVLYLVEPDLFGGDSFGLGGCYVPPSVFAQLNFLSSVYSPPCVATISVAPDPDAASGEIEVVDCDGNALIAEPGGRVIINGNDGCLCWEPPVAAEQSTWGKVKALYR